MENIEDEFLDKIIIPNLKNRVLTPYREDWGDGKPGALYFSEKNCALIKMDAPWRKNASPSEYQTLLPYELELMDNEDFWVAKGLPAFLLSGADFAMESNDFANRLFDQFFMLFRSFTLRKYFETLDYLVGYGIADMKSDWGYTKSHLRSFSPCLVEGCDEKRANNWKSLINNIQEIITCHIGGVYEFTVSQLLSIHDSYQIIYKQQQFILEKLPSDDVIGEINSLLSCIQKIIIIPTSRDNKYTFGGFPAFLLVYFINEIYQNEFNKRGMTNSKIKGIHNLEIDEISFRTTNHSLNQLEIFEAYTDHTIKRLQCTLPKLKEIGYQYLINNGAYAALLEYEKYFLQMAKEKLPNLLPINMTNSILKWTENLIQYVKMKCEELDLPEDLPSALTPEFLALFPHYKPVLESAVESNSVMKPQPAPESGLPPKGNYVAVVTWLQKEKAEGRDYFQEAGYNRAEMCRNLSEIFKWEVDSNSLGKTLKRRN